MAVTVLAAPSLTLPLVVTIGALATQGAAVIEFFRRQIG